MRISLLLAIVTITFFKAHAQEQRLPAILQLRGQEGNFKKEALNVLYGYMNRTALSQTPKGSFNMICIALTTDEKGAIVGAYTSLGISESLKTILKPGRDLLAAFQKNARLSGQYKSKTVIFPLLMVRWGTDPFTNDKQFAYNLENLWPDFPPDSSKPIVLLKPLVYTFDFPRHH